MGGVDKNDQMLSAYDCERKRVKKWYKKSFMHILNAIAFNCFVLANKINVNNKEADHLNFRKKLVLSLIEHHQLSNLHHRKGRTPVVDLVRLNERHFISHGTKSRRCRVCSAQQKRSSTRYQC